MYNVTRNCHNPINYFLNVECFIIKCFNKNTIPRHCDAVDLNHEITSKILNFTKEKYIHI